MLWNATVELQSKVFAEVGRAGFRAFQELVDGAREQDLAVADEVTPVDDGENLAGVVIGDQHADPFALEMADHRLDVVDGEWIDVRKGLIEQEEGGLDDQRAGDFEAAPLSSGKAARFLLARPVRCSSPRSVCRRFFFSSAERSRVSRMQFRLSSTVSWRKTEGSWAKVDPFPFLRAGESGDG